jgi:hypothetical protein
MNYPVNTKAGPRRTSATPDDLLCNLCWKFGVDPNCACQRSLPPRPPAPPRKSTALADDDDTGIDFQTELARSRKFEREMRMKGYR